MPSEKTRFGLDEVHIPEVWYNIMPDLKNPPAPPKAFAPDGTELTRLTERTTSDPWLALPAWVPDGSGLLVTVIRGDGDFALARLGADGQRLEDIVDPDTGDRIVGAHARQAPPSPD